MSVRLLIVDTDPGVRDALRRVLAIETDIEIVGAVGGGDELLNLASQLLPDVILLDPNVEGLEPADLTRKLLSALPGARVLAWTEEERGAVLVQMLLEGASGFILKKTVGPREVAALIRRAAAGEMMIGRQSAPEFVSEVVRLHGEALEYQASLEFAREALSAHVNELTDANASLEMAREALRSQLAEIRDTYAATVQALADAVELRDEYTGGHIERVRDYAVALAEAVEPSLTSEEYVYGYMLHDIGKLAIPDSVLLKPGKLTDVEFEMVKKHTTEGAKYVSEIPFLRPALPVVRNHHERWDGNGYPDGLKEEEIPMIARIFTVADTLDAITTDRPYRAARSLDAAMEEIERSAGAQFDPMVARVLREVSSAHPAMARLRAKTPAG